MGKVIQIREVGNPCLFNKSEKIEINNIKDKDIVALIEDLKETLEYSNGFGIAAPQIGINKQIVIIKIEKDKCTYRDAEDVPMTVMINPVWRKLTEEYDIQYEGCLSVPNIRGKVKRYKEIEVTYYTEEGEKIVKKVKGFTSRDIQHECDHLEGILFLEKVEPNGFATKEMINKYNLREK